MKSQTNPEACFLEASMPFERRLEWAPGSGFETLSVCKSDPDHKHTRARRPLRVVVPATPETDFLWTVYSDCLVSSKIRAVLENHDISGIDFRPVRTFAPSGTEIDLDLCELVPIGWGGLVHRSSQIELTEQCPDCGRTVFSTRGEGRIMFDIDAWDGSDFFIMWPLPVYKCASAGLMKLISEHGWTGVRFTAIEDWKVNLAGKIGPGLITSWIEGRTGKNLEAVINAELARRYPKKHERTA